MSVGPLASVLAACAARLGDDGPRALALLGGRVGEAARRAWRELEALEPAERERRRAGLIARARASDPTSRDDVHPSWIEAELAARAASPGAAITAGGEAGAAVEVWLARQADAALPPPVSAEAADELSARIASDPASVVGWLVDVGADQVAYALGPAAAASRPVLARAAVRIGEPPRAGQLGPRRAAIGRCARLAFDDEQAALLIVAGRTLAPLLAYEPLARWQLTRRLPHALGTLVEREIAAHVHDPVEQAPTWPALLAR